MIDFLSFLIISKVLDAIRQAQGLDGGSGSHLAY